MLNVVIPMAGRGQRFADRGFMQPKPFIRVEGEPLVNHATRFIRQYDGDYRMIYLVQKDHLGFMQGLATKDGDQIIILDGVTDGAACTVMKAAGSIASIDPVLIANCDCVSEIDITDFVSVAKEEGLTGLIGTFDASDPRFGYVRTRDGLADLVAEKDPISDQATTGLHYFRTGYHLIDAITSMQMQPSKKVNGEWYMLPTYNELIEQGEKIGIYPVAKHHDFGTPDALDAFCKAKGYDY